MELVFIKLNVIFVSHQNRRHPKTVVTFAVRHSSLLRNYWFLFKILVTVCQGSITGSEMDAGCSGRWMGWDIGHICVCVLLPYVYSLYSRECS